MTLTEPQVWTLIGVFAAAMFGVLGLIVQLVNRNMTAGFASLEKVMNVKFEAVDAKFDAVYIKLDHLDRDVTAISKKVFDIPD